MLQLHCLNPSTSDGDEVFEIVMSKSEVLGHPRDGPTWVAGKDARIRNVVLWEGAVGDELVLFFVKKPPDCEILPVIEAFLSRDLLALFTSVVSQLGSHSGVMGPFEWIQDAIGVIRLRITTSDFEFLNADRAELKVQPDSTYFWLSGSGSDYQLRLRVRHL